MQAWQEFALKIALQRGDNTTPYLIGLAIGMARDDDFLIQLCGREVNKLLEERGIDPRLAIGELESVVIFIECRRLEKSYRPEGRTNLRNLRPSDRCGQRGPAVAAEAQCAS